MNVPNRDIPAPNLLLCVNMCMCLNVKIICDPGNTWFIKFLNYDYFVIFLVYEMYFRVGGECHTMLPLVIFATD